MQSLLLRLLDRYRAPAPDPALVEWLGEWPYAHRGLHGMMAGYAGADGHSQVRILENSPSAFAAALQQGMGIECDVQRSQDGRAMVFHDWNLDRLTHETGPVDRREASALAQITLRDSSDTILHLSKLLDQIGGAVPLLIEIKSANDHRARALCLAVHRELEGYRGRHAIMSFDPRVSRWFAEYAPSTIRGLVISEEGEKSLLGHFRRHATMWHARPQFLAYDIRDLPSRFAASQRKRGLPVLTWTVRSSDDLDRAARYADAPIVEGEGAEALDVEGA